MPFGIGGSDKFDYDVEIIEIRNGVLQNWHTRGRVTRDRESNVPSYDVKGLPRLIALPSYNHIMINKKGGKSIKLYSPDADTYEVVAFDATEKKFKPIYNEYTKNWVDYKIKQANERWQIGGDLNKWLPLIMFFLTAIIFVAGMKFSTDSFEKSAEMGASATASFQQATGDLRGFIEECRTSLNDYRNTINELKELKEAAIAAGGGTGTTGAIG